MIRNLLLQITLLLTLGALCQESKPSFHLVQFQDGTQLKCLIIDDMTQEKETFDYIKDGSIGQLEVSKVKKIVASTGKVEYEAKLVETRNFEIIELKNGNQISDCKIIGNLSSIQSNNIEYIKNDRIQKVPITDVYRVITSQGKILFVNKPSAAITNTPSNSTVPKNTNTYEQPITQSSQEINKTTQNSPSNPTYNPTPNYQNSNCKAAEVFTDDFTEISTPYYGGKAGDGRSMLLGFSYKVTFYISREKGANQLSTVLGYIQGLSDASVNNFTMPEGSTVRIKTSLGLITHTITDIKSQKRRIGEKISTSIIMTSPISDAELKLLQSGLIEKYQVTPLNQQGMDGTVTTSKAQKIQSQVNCFFVQQLGQGGQAAAQQPIYSNNTGISGVRNIEKGAKYAEANLGFADLGGNLRFEYFFSDKWTIGVGLGGATASASEQVLTSSGYQTVTAKASQIHFVPQIRGYYLTREKTGLYIGLGLGVARVKAKATSGFVAYEVPAVTGFVGELQLGGRFHINENISLLGELALGGISAIKLGGAYSF